MPEEMGWAGRLLMGSVERMVFVGRVEAVAIEVIRDAWGLELGSATDFPARLPMAS